MISPPRMNIINTVTKVVPVVLMVLARVLFKAPLMLVLKSRFGCMILLFTDSVEDNNRIVDGVTDNR